MSDSLDDLLAALPCEPCPEGLVLRIQRELGRARRRALWVRHGMRVGALVAGLAGAWVAYPGMKGWALPLPEIQEVGAWLGLALLSPVEGASVLATRGMELWLVIIEKCEAGVGMVVALVSLAALYLSAEMIVGRRIQMGV